MDSGVTASGLGMSISSGSVCTNGRWSRCPPTSGVVSVIMVLFFRCSESPVVVTVGLRHYGRTEKNMVKTGRVTTSFDNFEHISSPRPAWKLSGWELDNFSLGNCRDGRMVVRLRPITSILKSFRQNHFYTFIIIIFICVLPHLILF